MDEVDVSAIGACFCRESARLQATELPHESGPFFIRENVHIDSGIYLMPKIRV